MKWILNIFLMGVMLASSLNVNAAESGYQSVNPIANTADLVATEGKCATVNFGLQNAVNPRDFSICSGDISYGLINLAFQKIFSENEILTSLGNQTESESTLAYSYNIGGPIIAVIEAVTWLTFTLSGLVLTYMTIKTLNISATSGQFMGNWSSVYVMLRTLGAMALIVPIGSFSLSQIIILVISLFAIMGGNYIWGSFLSMQQAEAIVVEETSLEFSSLALEQAESMVKSNMCSLRSGAASVELTQKENHPNWIPATMKEHVTRLITCNKNHMYVAAGEIHSTDVESGEGSASENQYPLKNIIFGSPKFCDSASDMLNKYEEEVYGELYQCGNIRFSTASLDKFIDEDPDVADEGWFTSTNEDIKSSIAEVESAVGRNGFYETVAAKAQGLNLSGAVFNGADYEGEINTLKNQLVVTGAKLFKQIKTNLESKSANPPAAYEGTYVALSAMISNYLGGGYDSDGYSSFWQKLVDFEISTLSVDNSVLIITESEKDLDLSPMYRDAKLAAAYALSAHCAKIWPEYYSLHDKTMKSLKDIKELGVKYFKYNSDKINLSTECIIPLYPSNGATDTEVASIFKQASEFEGSRGEAFFVALADSGGSRETLINLSKIDNSPEMIQAAVNNIVSDSEEKSKSIIAGMTAYNYVVREAFQDSLAEIFQTATDPDKFTDMRNLGWAAAGGFILALSNEGANINKYSSSLQSQVSWDASNSNNKYLDASVILRKGDDFNFSSMNSVMSKILNNNGLNDEYSVLSERESYLPDFSEFFDYMENLITYPLNHLKRVGGFDQNSSLRQGAQKCYENGECGITSVHPVTALLRVGNDLIDLCFTLLVLQVVVASLAALANASAARGSTGGAKAANKNKESSVLSKLLGGALSVFGPTKIILEIAKYISPVLTMITSIFVPPMFLVGIFFSFVVPMMPFIAFLVGFIAWLMLILELLIAVNIWVLLFATPDQNGNSRADVRSIFGFLAQLLLKPALMVVGLVFGWYLSSISIYFLNMTIFGALSPSETGSLFGLFDMMMFYILYLILIFVAIKHSFKVIELLPDKIFSLISVARSGDQQSESLGFERLAQMAAGQQLLNVGMKPGQIIENKRSSLQDKIDRMKDGKEKDLGEELRRNETRDKANQQDLDDATEMAKEKKGTDAKLDNDTPVNLDGSNERNSSSEPKPPSSDGDK